MAICEIAQDDALTDAAAGLPGIEPQEIAEYYPVIPEEHVLMATSPDDKIVYLEKILKQYGSFIYIDDNHPALMKYENHFGDECKFFHVSSLYV